MSHSVTVNLPDDLYAKAQQISKATTQSLEEVVLNQLQITWHEFTDIPAQEQAELQAMKFLSDDALRGIAQEQMPKKQQAEMDNLMQKNNLGTISELEYEQLEKFVLQSQQRTLRKAQASALLKERYSS